MRSPSRFTGLSRAMVAAVGVTVGCSSFTSSFTGTIGGNFYEPTGTVFMWRDDFMPPPGLERRNSVVVGGNPLKDRLIVTGVYAYFDATRDQSSLSGSGLAELKHEIENNDWLSLEWDDIDAVQAGTNFKAVVLRDDEENIYRTPDPSASDATAGFSARVRFRRPSLGRNARYDCGDTPAPLCQEYRPFGSQVSVSVTPAQLTSSVGGSTTFDVIIAVNRAGSDPETAVAGQLNGRLSAQLVGERSAETNMDLLGLYDLFRLEE